jgi:hypothetical protein
MERGSSRRRLDESRFERGDFLWWLERDKGLEGAAGDKKTIGMSLSEPVQMPASEGIVSDPSLCEKHFAPSLTDTESRKASEDRLPMEPMGDGHAATAGPVNSIIRTCTIGTVRN